MFPVMRFCIADKSMLPVFKEGDYVLVNKLAYIFSAPKVGDVVVARHNGMFIIKRVVETGRICTVAGDNKEHSSQIRLEKENIIGKVLLHGRH